MGDSGPLKVESVEAHFRTLHAAMLDEFNRTGAVSYGNRAKLARVQTFWPNDPRVIVPVAETFVHTLNNHLFKSCALKTAHAGPFPEKERVLEAVNSLDPATSTIGDSFVELARYKFQSQLENEMYYHPEMSQDEQDGIAAAFSCVRAMDCHTCDLEFDINNENFRNGVNSLFDMDAATENDSDTEDWDSAFFSSVAVAHGAPWEGEKKVLDIEARTEFWRWHVTEAVPNAFGFALSCVGLDELD